MRYLILLALLVAVAISGCDSQNDNGILVNVRGTVTQEPGSVPVEGVEIEISLLFDSAPSEHIVTDAQGEYVFEKLISRESCTLEFSYAHPRDDVTETRSVPCVEGEQIVDVSFPATTFKILSATLVVQHNESYYGPFLWCKVFSDGPWGFSEQLILDGGHEVGDTVVCPFEFEHGAGPNPNTRVEYGHSIVLSLEESVNNNTMYSSPPFTITQVEVAAGLVTFDGGSLVLAQ